MALMAVNARAPEGGSLPPPRFWAFPPAVTTRAPNPHYDNHLTSSHAHPEW